MAPREEFYNEIDAEGFPVFYEALAKNIRQPGNAQFINPPDGCFGDGSVALKTHTGQLQLNTSSFITYAR